MNLFVNNLILNSAIFTFLGGIVLESEDPEVNEDMEVDDRDLNEPSSSTGVVSSYVLISFLGRFFSWKSRLGAYYGERIDIK